MVLLIAIGISETHGLNAALPSPPIFGGFLLMLISAGLRF
jgi:hypothetical protein